MDSFEQVARHRHFMTAGADNCACGHCDKMIADSVAVASDAVRRFVELARLGAVLQDNPEREKVLTQFANLMQSFLPKSPVPEEK